MSSDEVKRKESSATDDMTSHVWCKGRSIC